MLVRSRYLISGLTLAASLLGAAALVVTSDPSSSASWRDRIVDCADGDMTERNLIGKEVQDCLLAVMLDSVERDQVMAMQSDLAAQIQQSPDLYAACHTVGHKAGQAAFAAKNDIAALISQNRTTTCQYAIGHGVLDGFALTSPTDVQFQAAADACTALRDGEEEAQKAFKLCSDGLGHAAWTSTLEPIQAVLRCRMLEDTTSQELCGEGVIMQIYEPAGTEPSADIALASKELPVLCTNWPDQGATKMGCFSGAGYIYTREAWTLHYSRNSDGVSELNPEQRRQMQTYMTQAADKCRAHPETDGVSRCLFSMSQQIPPSIFVEDQLANAICDALGEWRQRCLDFRFIIS
jgi:hypothetical protein